MAKKSKAPLQGNELIEYLDEIEKAGMQVTKEWFDIWRAATAYVWGAQLEEVRRIPDWDYLVINVMYPLLMQSIAKQSKSHPRILVHPWDEKEADFAERWQGLLQYMWQGPLNMRMEGIYAQLDAAIFGYSVGKVDWNRKLSWDDQSKRWMGDVSHRLQHPCGFWCDPNAEKFSEARRMGTVRKVSVEWAKQQWPEFADEIEERAGEPDELAEYEYTGSVHSYMMPEVNYGNQTARGRISSMWNRFVAILTGSEMDKQSTTSTGSGDQEDQKAKSVWVRETYFFDPSEDRIKIEDRAAEADLIAQGIITVDPQDPNQQHRWVENGEPVAPQDWPMVTKAEYDKPLFPNGRVVLRIGKTILNPKIEQQRYTRKRWPFNVMVYHAMPHMWQGSNAVEFSRGPQDMLNITVSYLIHHLKTMANPQKVIEQGALAKDKRGKVRTVKNRAGEWIVVRRGALDKVRNLAPERLDPSAWTLIQFLTSDIERQHFMHAIAQGKGTKNMSATEAARLDTNANDLVYLRNVMFENWVEGTARNIAEVLQENYDENRRVRIIGWSGDTMPMQMPQQMLDVDIDVEIESGTTLPFDEERTKQDYLAAYKLCGDPSLNPMLEEVLRKLNITNRDKILQRHQQLQVFKQFMALAQTAQRAAQEIQQAAQQPGPDGQPQNPERVAAATQAIQGQIMQRAMQLLSRVGQIQTAQPGAPT